MFTIWSLVPLPFLNPAGTSESSQFTYSCWSLAWRILSIALLHVKWMQLCSSLSIFGIGMKTDHFQTCGHFWVFQICWHIECSTFTASPFRIWNSSTGIPSPSLTLFVVMLSKAHLTCLALGEWSHHMVMITHLGHEDLFSTVLLCILSTSS